MLNKSKTNWNENYAAEIIKVGPLRKPEKADRLRCFNHAGNNLITGTNVQERELMVYFPIECAIDKKFLAFTNSLEDATLNRDTTKKGFFGKRGRVKAIVLRGEKSGGYVVPVYDLEEYSKVVLGKTLKIKDSDVGTIFDMVFDNQLCQKYVLPTKQVQGPSQKTKGKTKRYESKLVDGQFFFHTDTSQLARNLHMLDPWDKIAITEKLHGANFIVSKVLVKRKLTWKDKLAKWLGAKIVETEYGEPLYASRAVIKNKNFETNEFNFKGFYNEDIWAIVNKRLSPALSNGETAYGEVVGFTPSGKFIQKNFDYGNSPNELDFYVFKVTHTDPCGKVRVYSHEQTVAWCKEKGVKMVPVHFYGTPVKFFFDWENEYGTIWENDTDEHHKDKYRDWKQEFYKKLSDTFLEQNCKMCKNVVPREGVVVRLDKPFQWEVYKAKSFLFLKNESLALDSGEVSVEDEEVDAAKQDTEESPIEENLA